MQHIKVISEGFSKKCCRKSNIGCGECQTSCQSAAKTDIAVDIQACENFEDR